MLFNPSYTVKSPAVELLPNQMSVLPYRPNKTKSAGQLAGQSAGLRMQASNGKGVMRKLAEESQSTNEIKFCPSQYDSPERV